MNLDAFVTKNAPIACKGIFLAIGMSGAVIFGEAINLPTMSPFAAFGAMTAMQISPRHGVRARLIGALAGCLFLLLAASLSLVIAGIPLLALVLLFVLSWLAALPKKDLKYIGFVAKCGAVAVLLSYFDFTPTAITAIYFCSGFIFGLFLSLAAMAFEPENEKGPIEQFRAFLRGDMNQLYYSLIIPVTVVISSLIADIFSYSNPAWVGLTVIFVADSDHRVELKRLLERVIGTVAAAFVSYLILSYIHMPLRLALIVGAFAFFMPFFIKRYALFSFLITCVVLILIDIVMLGHGGDMRLLLWRCVDTVFGCACVLVPNLIQYIYWRKKHADQKKQVTATVNKA